MSNSLEDPGFDLKQLSLLAENSISLAASAAISSPTIILFSSFRHFGHEGLSTTNTYRRFLTVTNQ